MEVIFFFIPFFLFPVTCVSLSFWQRKMVQRSFLVLGRSFIHHCIKLSKLAKYLCHPYHCNKVLRIGLTISKTHICDVEMINSAYKEENDFSQMSSSHMKHSEFLSFYSTLLVMKCEDLAALFFDT
eukprot:TRINITY_DN4814_c1_g1_i1.p1 TRINITY_DN4814_c1_g1~~TRINITY_DN4814_c1_g1_i1.p1  ORF type:complete len:126 (+),score=9.88 TRINITY_DN4814_c1_g1_i1:274-651(+)